MRRVNKHKSIDSDSDSDSSSEEQLSSSKEHPPRRPTGPHPAFLPLLLAALAFIAILIVLTQSPTKPHMRHETQTPIITRAAPNSSHPQALPVPNMTSEHTPKLPQYSREPLPGVDLLVGTPLMGASFLANQLRSGKELWFKRRELLCQDEQVINSGVKLGPQFYLQNTVYSDLTLVAQAVKIPQQNPYRYEGLRQFLVNMTRKYPKNIVVVNHPSPMPLLITAVTLNAPIYLIQRQENAMIELALILNDVHPLVNKLPSSYLQGSFDFLLTNSLDSSIELVIDSSRNITILLDIIEPVQAQSALLRKIRFYRIGEGNGCESRTVEIYEPGEWRIEQKSWLTIGFYLLTSPSHELDLTFEKREYKSKLVKPRSSVCSNIHKQPIEKRSFQTMNKMKMSRLPYNNLILLSNGSWSQTVFPEVFAYFRDGPSYKTVHFMDGLPSTLLLSVAALPLTTVVTYDSAYTRHQLLNKNLVINDLQTVTAGPLPSPKKDLIVITTPFKIRQLSPKYQRVLLVVEQEHKTSQFHGYSIEKITLPDDLCLPSTRESVLGQLLFPGVYQLRP